MSSFNRVTKNPLTGEFENADWIDNKFGRYAYGVYFPSTGIWYRESEHHWVFLPSDSEDQKLLKP